MVDAYEDGDNIIGVFNADRISYALKEEDAKRVKVYYNDES